MEYAVALEELAHAQADRIIEVEASVDGQTVFTDSSNYVVSAVTMGGSKKDLKDLRAMMKKITASVTTQAAILAALYIRENSGGSGGGKNTEKKKERPGLHLCAHCKR